METASYTHDPALKFAVLEGRMNTHQAKYEGALERFRASNAGALERLRTDIARRDGNLRTDISRRDEEFARRETRIVLAVVGMIALATAVVGTLLAFLAFTLGNVAAEPGTAQTSAVPEVRSAEPVQTIPLPDQQANPDARRDGERDRFSDI